MEVVNIRTFCQVFVPDKTYFASTDRKTLTINDFKYYDLLKQVLETGIQSS